MLFKFADLWLHRHNILSNCTKKYKKFSLAIFLDHREAEVLERCATAKPWQEENEEDQEENEEDEEDEEKGKGDSPQG